MPQLAIETFFTQYFWLLVILFLFNDFILHKYIPGISKLLKARKETSTYVGSEIVSDSLSLELPTFSGIKSSKINNFSEARVNWISKHSN